MRLRCDGSGRAMGPCGGVRPLPRPPLARRPPQVGILSAAIVAWFGTVAAYALLRDRARLGGRLVMTVAVLLYPTAAGTAFGLLACQIVSVNSLAVASLDGGGAYATATARALVSVPLLSSDPFYVCYAGSHRPAAYLAVAAVVAVVALLPVATLAMLWRDGWLRATLARSALAAGGGGSDSCASLCQRRGAAAAKVKPLSGAALAYAAPPEEAPETESVGDARTGPPELDATRGAPEPALPPPPAADPLLSPFLGDSGYRPDCWWFRHVDMGVTLALAAIEAFVPRPVTSSQVGSAGVLVVGGSAVHTSLCAPVPAARRQAHGDTHRGRHPSVAPTAHAPVCRRPRVEAPCAFGDGGMKSEPCARPRRTSLSRRRRCRRRCARSSSSSRPPAPP